MGTPPKDNSKLFEGELTRLHDSVADRVNTPLIEELRAAVSARDEFLAIAAHELRNPMGAIVLSVQTLRMAAEKSGPSAPPMLQEKLASLERRIAQYVKRATMLLDVTRLTSGNFQLEIEPVNLSHLVRELLTDSSDDFQRAHCQLSLTLDEEVVGQWDRMALEQLLTNLLSNALKYGAGHPIEVELIADASNAHFQIRDHGIGISEEDQHRIFQKFERAVKRRQHGGFGVGLWVSRQIVEGLGGSISVQSAPGQGSAFHVSLPRNLAPGRNE